MLDQDIYLRACQRGSPIRESGRPLTTGRQRAHDPPDLLREAPAAPGRHRLSGDQERHPDARRQRRPGAAVTTRGEIVIKDSEVTENLAEEPGGAIFSQRRATIIRSVITGNLANDDGGGVYARRGGIEVYDSIISNNLVDGSGGALGSTGDILVVRSHVDGNTTDGDGGAIYTDEDGDVTVIDSTVDGNTADGPGGAIFTLEGDVTIINSTLNGNRADDRGGAISGEADVTVIDSTDRPQRRVRARRRRDLGPQRYVRDQLDDQPQLRRGPGGRGPRCRGPGPGQLDRGRQRRPGRRGRGRGIASPGLRLGHRPTRPGTRRRPDPADRVQLPSLAPGVVRLQLRHRRLLRPRRPERRGRRKSDAQRPPGRSTAASGRRGCQSRAVPSWTGSPPSACNFVPFGYSLEGEQHLGQFGIDPLAPVTADQRGVSRPQGAGCDAGAVERGGDGRRRPPGGGRTPRPLVRLLDRSERMIKRMERPAKRWRRWTKCISEVPVSEYGDADHRFGFLYDERDGTGLDRRPALGFDYESRRPNLVLLQFSRREGCRGLGTEPTQPGTPGTPGTADPAKLSRPRAYAAGRAWARSSGDSMGSSSERPGWRRCRSSSTSWNRAFRGCP